MTDSLEKQVRHICTYSSPDDIGAGVTCGYSLTEEQFEKLFKLMDSEIKRAKEETLDAVKEELFVLPYLCPFCADRQNEVTGECECDCHSNEHVKAYEKQLRSDLEALKAKIREEKR